MRDLWEHIIAHYMYAFGGMIMSWAQLFAFRHQVHGPLALGTKVVFMLGSLIYGLLLAGIAIEFPDGLYGKSNECKYSNKEFSVLIILILSHFGRQLVWSIRL